MLLNLNRVPVFHHSSRRHFVPATICDAALAYVAAGFSLIPIAADGTKDPAFSLLPRVQNPAGEWRPSWNVYRDRKPTREEIHEWFFNVPKHCLPGLAILGGQCSGGLEVLDVDNADVFEAFQSRLLSDAPELFEKIVWVRSPRPGVHGYFRFAEAGRSRKIACKPTSEGPRALIEIKAEGGCCVAPPSPGACHPRGKRYRYLTQRDLTDIRQLSFEERELLIAIAGSFDQMPETTAAVRPASFRTGNLVSTGQLPGDRFNATATWPEILEPHGWQLLGEGPGEVGSWRRPGKSSGSSATTNYGGSDLLYVFSANAHPFESDNAYSKFAAYVLLEHGGDFKAGARALGAGTAKATPFLRRPTLRDRYR
jgi:hypothetical protein